jgi:hypothetical protein
MVRMLQQRLPAKPSTGTAQEQFKSLIDQYFGGTFDVELKCTETDDEQVTKNKEQFLQLSCFISQDVRYMHSGLRSKMQEQITKKSSILDRDAVYIKTSKISRLPAYLTIQFVRFYYKEKESINAKILKDVKFPIDFDAFDLCTPELQEKLAPVRAKFKVIPYRIVCSNRCIVRVLCRSWRTRKWKPPRKRRTRAKVTARPTRWRRSTPPTRSKTTWGATIADIILFRLC